MYIPKDIEKIIINYKNHILEWDYHKAEIKRILKEIRHSYNEYVEDVKNDFYDSIGEYKPDTFIKYAMCYTRYHYL